MKKYSCKFLCLINLDKNALIVTGVTHFESLLDKLLSEVEQFQYFYFFAIRKNMLIVIKIIY